MAEWKGTVVLTTSRLILRTFKYEDLPLYAALNADPEVMREVGGPITRETSDEIAEWAQECHARERIGLLAVERVDDRAFLGMCGLHRLESYPDDIEVGWRLAAQYWRHGYATEAANAWLEHAFEELRLSRVISTTTASNARSLAVMRRLGMRFDHEGDIDDNGQQFPVVVYVVTADEWRARNVGA